MLNRKIERTNKSTIEPPTKKPVKIYDRITDEEAFILKEYWESKNFSGFNEYIQRTGSKLNVLEAIQVIKNTQFSVKLELENFSGLFKGKFTAKGVGKNKKEARRNAISSIIDQLIKNKLLINIDDFQMNIIKGILQEKQKDSNNINNNFNSNNNSENNNLQINNNNNKDNNNNINEKDNNNLFKKISNFIQQEKEGRQEYFKLIQKSKEIDDKTKMIQLYSKILIEGKIEESDKILKAIENLCQLLKNKLDWNDISLIWYQYLIKGDKENLENILNILFSKKNTEFINPQIKQEILDSFMFLIPNVNSWNKILDLINVFFNNVSYFNEDIPFTDYYCFFKKCFHIELLDTLFHLFRNEGNINSLNLINSIEVVGNIQVIGSRFGQEICTFLPQINANFIQKIKKEKKTKFISENELVSIELNKNKKQIGLISKINNDLTIKLRKNFSNNLEKVKSENIKIQKILNLFVYQKTLECFRDFCINDDELLSNQLRQIIIGSYLGTYDSNLLRNLALTKMNELPEGYKIINQSLNKSQINAVEKSLTERLTLILGPPGTGKTITCVEIVCEYVRLQRLKIQEERNKILVCAESNCAIDIIYSHLKNKSNISVYKYSSKDNSDSFYGIIKANIIYSDVIVCTNVSSSNEFLKTIPFPFVIIDECSQATELSTLIPLLHHCEQLVLIGDHKQLPPTIISSEAIKLGLNKSLFERLYEFQINSCQLDTQYRMHSSLFEFSSKEFYDNKIISGIKNEDRILTQIKFPNQDYNIMFINVNGVEQIESKSNSCFNDIEVNKVINVIQKIQNDISDKSIGIITPYDSQKNKIKKAIFDNKINDENIIVDTIDGFQGMERDIIIVSLVRSNDSGKIGFVNDSRRVNVLLTRAKYALIVIGNENCLKNNGIWKKWMGFVREKNLI